MVLNARQSLEVDGVGGRCFHIHQSSRLWSEDSRGQEHPATSMLSGDHGTHMEQEVELLGRIREVERVVLEERPQGGVALGLGVGVEVRAGGVLAGGLEHGRGPGREVGVLVGVGVHGEARGRCCHSHQSSRELSGDSRGLAHPGTSRWSGDPGTHRGEDGALRGRNHGVEMGEVGEVDEVGVLEVERVRGMALDG